MTLKTISYFCEACKDLQFSKTVQRLFITPQSLSQAIRSLEDELKCHLFLRTSTGLQLTAEGVYLQERASSILETLQEIQDTLSAKPEQHAVSIHLLTGTSSMLSTLLPLNFRHHTITYRELPASTCIENVRLGRTTAAISITPPGKSFDYRPLWSSPLCAIVSINHPLSQEEYLLPEQLQHQSVLTANCYMDLNDYIINQFTAHGISFRQRIPTPTPLDSLGLCERNLGITLCPQQYLAHFRILRPNIRILPIHGNISMDLCFISAANSSCAQTEAVYSLLSESFRKTAAPEFSFEI